MTLPPGLILILGAVAIPFLPRLLRRLAVPVLAGLVLVQLGRLEPGLSTCGIDFAEGRVELLDVTWLRQMFGWAFGLATLLWGIYAWDNDDRAERTAGLLYAGCALFVVFAGGWLPFFVGWEGMALASTGVILAARTPHASRVAFRYLLVHLFGGVVLLCGIALLPGDASFFSFEGLHGDHVLSLGRDGLAAWLIFLGFAVNAAVWPVAAWLPDAYPEASPTGTVLLGTYTTKTAVFAFAFFFAGETLLCLLGAGMAIYAVLYALSTRNYRRLLAYSLVGQVGFMLCAVGVGGALGQGAAAAHAQMHVLYKSLLFMTAGAVLLRTGQPLGGGLGGLARRMPITAACAVVGAAAISAVPLTNGYLSKSLILDAVHGSPERWAHWAQTVLYVASAAAPLYVGLRYLWLVFGGRDEGVEAAPAPPSMRLGMGIAAVACLVLGVVPGLWMTRVPGAGDVHPFAPAHVGKQLLLLAAGTIVFLLWRRLARGRPAGPTPGPLPDTDRLWLRGAAAFDAFVRGPLMGVLGAASTFVNEGLPRAAAYVARNPAGFMQLMSERLRLGLTALFGTPAAVDRAQARFADQAASYRTTKPAQVWPIGRTALFVTLLLATSLLIWLLN